MPSDSVDFRFPKSHHLCTRADFDRVFEQGARVGSRRLLAFVCANAVGHPRIGFATSRKLGNAVRRNRIRRVMREAYRLNQQMLSAGVDVAFLPKRDWSDYRLGVVERSMQSVLRKINERCQREVADH